MRLLIVTVGLLALLGGCSSSRSTPEPLRDGGDMQLLFPDGWTDMFVPLAGTSLRSEIVAAGGLVTTPSVSLQLVAGEAVSSQVASGGSYTIQWDSVVLPNP